MQHSVAIPASLNLSVRDHINSTCHALLIGWDGKYGYPHQYLMREGGRREGRRSKGGSVGRHRRPEKQKRGRLTIYSLAPPRGLKPDNFFFLIFYWNYGAVHLFHSPFYIVCLAGKEKKRYQMNRENKQRRVQINRNPQKGENKTTTSRPPPPPPPPFEVAQRNADSWNCLQYRSPPARERITPLLSFSFICLIFYPLFICYG